MREAAEGSGSGAEDIFLFSAGVAGGRGGGRGHGDFMKRDSGAPVLPSVLLPQSKLHPWGWRLLAVRQPLRSLTSLRHQEGNFLP